jgi:phage terminase Nu1 subunit (DNA packaging protein)
LDFQITQADFANLIGVSEGAVSAMFTEAKLERGNTGRVWLLKYCDRLREQAAGRLGSEDGGLDLVQERAGLARSQRISQDMKNDIARGEYAPVGLLADVLGMASSAVVDRFEQLEGALRKACPMLPDDAKATVMQVIASARNEWIRSTSKLVSETLDAMAAEDDDELARHKLNEGFQRPPCHPGRRQRGCTHRS